MKSNLIALGAVVLVLGGVLLLLPFVAPRERTTTPVSEEARHEIEVEGVLVRDGKHLKPGVWYVGFEYEGEKVAAELAFNEESVCAGKTRSGICNPDLFVIGRRARVVGDKQNEAVMVRLLQFLDPLATSTAISQPK